jgi:hypothetical protein
MQTSCVLFCRFQFNAGLCYIAMFGIQLYDMMRNAISYILSYDLFNASDVRSAFKQLIIIRHTPPFSLLSFPKETN